MQEGYLIIATDKRVFLENALNLALSLRLKDNRPIALLYDKIITIPEEYKNIFDYRIKIQDEDKLFKNLNKLLLFKYTPFERTMYIDADCLMAKDDISITWNRLKKYHFTAIGEKAYEGDYWGLDIKKIREKLNIPYVARINSGVIFFDKTEISGNVFKKSKEYIEHESDLQISFRGSHHDEVLWSITMGDLRLEPFPIIFRHYWKFKQWMQCTSSTCESDVDIFKGISCLHFEGYKKGHYDDPTIVHFTGFCHPKEIYLREANKLREHFGLPLLKPEDVGLKRGEHKEKA